MSKSTFYLENGEVPKKELVQNIQVPIFIGNDLVFFLFVEVKSEDSGALIPKLFAVICSPHKEYFDHYQDQKGTQEHQPV